MSYNFFKFLFYNALSFEYDIMHVSHNCVMLTFNLFFSLLSFIAFGVSLACALPSGTEEDGETGRLLFSE